MKRLIFAFTLAVSALAVHAQKQYSNPVINRSAPDPTVIRVGNIFYLYSTENIHNVPIFRSQDLITWRLSGRCFTDDTRPQMVPGGGIWAPDINKIGDKYVLYYSKSTWGGEWECGIGVATADSPLGPFTDVGPLFISSEIDVQNSIDPFFIEDNDRKYLFWGSFRGIYAIELSEDGLNVKEGASKRKVAGTRTEGTTIHKRGNYYYLIGSAGSCCEGANSTYHLLVARSKRLLGPYYDRSGNAATSNHFEMLLQRNEHVIGPGHCSEVFQDDAGQDWILYHGYDANDPDAGRKVYLDRIQWDENDWPYINDGTPSIQADAPLFGETVEVDELPEETEGFVVRPRSVRDSFLIESTFDNSTFRWQLVNLHGEVIKQGTTRRRVHVNMNDVPEGMYIVNIKSKKSETSQKILRIL